MPAGGVGDGFAAQKVGNFLGPFGFIQCVDLGDGAALVQPLAHREVEVSPARNLRQVGDDDGLVRGRQVL